MQFGLRFGEAHHRWSRDRYECSDFELLEHFVKFCLPLTKNKNLPKEAPLEHPRLLEFSTLGTLKGGVDAYYLERAKADNQIRLKALGERVNEEFMGKWDGDEYMNEVNWPEKN